jgi:alkyl hydroperoxide reductase subunit AhpC
MQGEFRALNCELVGLSIDSTFKPHRLAANHQGKGAIPGHKDVEVTFP